MLVSRVGVKLDEGHLLLKLAVFPAGTKKNNVKSYSPFTSTDSEAGIGNFTGNSNGTTVQP